MQSVQLFRKHSAQLPVMQVAYAQIMERTSLRRARRHAKLIEIVREYEGGATALAARIGTPKSHISAMQAGRRGVGDDLAERIEAAAGKPPGWMDRDEQDTMLTDAERAVIAAMRGHASSSVTPIPAPTEHMTGLRKTDAQKRGAHVPARRRDDAK